MRHALAEQNFRTYEDVQKWVSEWLALKPEKFFCTVSTNYVKDGENV